MVYLISGVLCFVFYVMGLAVGSCDSKGIERTIILWIVSFVCGVVFCWELIKQIIKWIFS